MKKFSFKEQFREGIITNNPTFVQLLGTCPALATTTSALNALGMGISVLIILTFSNLVISLLRKIIPDQIRIASYIVIISGFVTMLEMAMKAFIPALSNSLGLFIPLIVVNCIILARAEAFASKNKVLPSVVDGISMGAGFTVALVILGSIREVIGAGTIFGTQVFGGWYEPAVLFILPPGAFLTLGFVIALVQKLRKRREDYKRQLEIETRRREREMSLSSVLMLILSAVFIDNFVLTKFMGCCPFLGVSSKPDTALGMGFAVTFVMTLSSAVTNLLYDHVLKPYGLEYLKTIAFILVIASLVQMIEFFLKNKLPSLYESLGIYLPLITTNCAVLGAALLNIQQGYGFIESVIYGFASGVGFTMAILILAGVRSRLHFSNPPKSFRGIPLVLITAGLISMAFMGFSGMKLGG